MIKSFVLGAAMLIGATISSHAASICNYNAGYANVRSGPSAQEFGVIDEVPNGHYVNVLGDTYNRAGYRWVRISYMGGPWHDQRRVGWVDEGSICN